MEFTFFIFIKLIASFTLIILGFIARRFVGVDRIPVAQLVFYLISPIVFFHAVAKLKPNLIIFILPLITASIASILAIMAFKFTKNRFDEASRSIFAFTSTNSNVGYFLLPIVWEIFDDTMAGIFVVMVLGNNIYENTVGFFIASMGKFSSKESLMKIIKLPSLYALLLGLIFSMVDHLTIPEMFNDMLLNIRGAYSTLGMMIVGFGLADIKDLKLDFKFIGSSLLVKFFLWPLLTIIIISIDSTFIQAYDQEVHKMLILFSVAPLAANNIVIASVLNLHPEKVAASVVASTIFALFYVPIIITIFGLV
jgi:predicted permease